MNILENILYQAVINAKACHPKRLEDIKKDIPYIYVFKNSIANAWDVTGHNYENHDNANRMNLYLLYLKHAIFPNLSKEVDVGGYYNIELHDSYTYIDRGGRNCGDTYKDVLTFSKFKDDIAPVLIPDPYMVTNWNNVVVEDNTPWDTKTENVCFFGTTTGNRNPLLNRRIQMCIWALHPHHKEHYNFKITHVAQMQEIDIIKTISLDKWKQIYHPRIVSYKDQLLNKFQYLPDGNTCKFDTWYFNTNTLNFKDVSNEMLWYYPLMQSGTHFVEVDEHTMEQRRIYYLNNPKEAEHIIYNSKSLATALFKPFNHIFYCSKLFEEIAHNK